MKSGRKSVPVGNKDFLILGDWNARCDGCGFKFKFSELKKDWKGLMKCTVANGCWEPRHPMDLQQAPRPSLPLPTTRPVRDVTSTGLPQRMENSVSVNVLVENTMPTGTFNVTDPIG